MRAAEDRRWHVLEQDREMLASMPADARKRAGPSSRKSSRGKRA